MTRFSLLAIGGLSTIGLYKTYHRDDFSFLHYPLRYIDPERAHAITLWCLKHYPIKQKEFPEYCNVKVGNLTFTNPVGLAAGFDKNGVVIDKCFGLGLGFVEIGSVTPLPQPGNTPPRVWRISNHSIRNHLGLPSMGFEKVLENIQSYPVTLRLTYPAFSHFYCIHIKDRYTRGIVGVNIARGNNGTNNDYLKGIETFIHHASYLVVNISCPNVDNLCDAYRKDQLRILLTDVMDTKTKVRGQAPILLKISPDLTDDQLQDVADVCMEKKIDGIIVGNTMRSDEKGGISGSLLFRTSNYALASIYKATKGTIPLIGAGGVNDGETAVKKIKAGASLIQLYTGLVTRGPRVIGEINDTLKQYDLKEIRGKDVEEILKKE